MTKDIAGLSVFLGESLLLANSSSSSNLLPSTFLRVEGGLFFVFFLIEVSLIYNVVLVSDGDFFFFILVWC